MKIKLKVQITGTRNAQRWPAPGSEIELPDGEAADLCAAGLAEPVVEDRVQKAVPKKSVEKRA